MTNSADPDQLASSETNWSGSTLFAVRVYPGSAGLGLIFLHENICCWYSLEVPCTGASNEYTTTCFCAVIRQILYGYPLLTGAM